MELTQIRYFLEVAETQHITKSAEKLHIAQPSLTQAIHRLEDSLGVPLFMSRGRNIVLTEYGRYLQKRLIPIVEELDMLPEQLKIMAKLSTETIHLNVLAASSLITEAVIDYKNNKKNLNFQLMQSAESDVYDIEITTRMSHDLKKGYSKEYKDIGIDIESNSDNKSGKENEFICEEKIFLAVPNVEKFAERQSIKLAEVMNEGFISLAGSKQFSAICAKFCQSIGFKPRIIFESDNPTAVKNMIMANMGVGFWPEFTWGAIDNEHVKLLEIEEMRCKRDVVISYNLNKNDNGNVIDFFEFLKSYCLQRKR